MSKKAIQQHLRQVFDHMNSPRTSMPSTHVTHNTNLDQQISMIKSHINLKQIEIPRTYEVASGAVQQPTEQADLHEQEALRLSNEREALRIVSEKAAIAAAQETIRIAAQETIRIAQERANQEHELLRIEKDQVAHVQEEIAKEHEDLQATLEQITIERLALEVQQENIIHKMEDLRLQQETAEKERTDRETAKKEREDLIIEQEKIIRERESIIIDLRIDQEALRLRLAEVMTDTSEIITIGDSDMENEHKVTISPMPYNPNPTDDAIHTPCLSPLALDRSATSSNSSEISDNYSLVSLAGSSDKVLTTDLEDLL